MGPRPFDLGLPLGAPIVRCHKPARVPLLGLRLGSPMTRTRGARASGENWHPIPGRKLPSPSMPSAHAVRIGFPRGGGPWLSRNRRATQVTRNAFRHLLSLLDLLACLFRSQQRNGAPVHHNPLGIQIAKNPPADLLIQAQTENRHARFQGLLNMEGLMGLALAGNRLHNKPALSAFKYVVPHAPKTIGDLTS